MSYSSEVLADSPLAYWRLGEASGTTMTDSSGNGRNGTYVNTPTLGTTGLLSADSDTAMTVADNSGQCGSLASATWMNSIQTVEAWVQFSSAGDGANGDAIVTRYATGGFNWLLWRNTSGKIAAQVKVGATTYNVATTANYGGATGVIHAAWTHDGTTIRLYVNGVEAANVAASGVIATGSTALEVARYSGANGTTPGAVMDEVAVYGTALSGTRIAAHYSAGTAAPATTGTVQANLPALSASAAGTVTTAGSVAATLPTLSASVAGTVAGITSGSVAATLPSLSASIAGTIPATTSGAVGATLPSLSAQIRTGNPTLGTFSLTAKASLTASLPTITLVPLTVSLATKASLSVATRAVKMLAVSLEAKADMRVTLPRHQTVDPVTGLPQYRLLAVTQDGTALGELPRAAIGEHTTGLGLDDERLTFTLPKYDVGNHIVTARKGDSVREVQLWRGPNLEAWVKVDGDRPGDGVTEYDCSSLAGYLKGRVVGRTPKTDWLINGDFTNGEYGWSFGFEAGSQPAAAPTHEVVDVDFFGTAAKALKLGGADVVTQIQAEVKTAAVFAPNSATYVSGGEAKIQAAGANIPNGTDVHIVGYTAFNWLDGDYGDGLTLSLNRARAARATLAAMGKGFTFSIDPALPTPNVKDTSLGVAGRGRYGALNGNNTYAEQEENRRVVFSYAGTVTFDANAAQYAQGSLLTGTVTVPVSEKRGLPIAFRGWAWLDSMVKKSRAGYGVYIQIAKASAPDVIVEEAHSTLDETSPVQVWDRHRAEVTVPPDGLTYIYTVRPYAPKGSVLWTACGVYPAEALHFPGVDRVLIVKGLVEHAQDPAMGKLGDTPVLIGTRTPLTGKTLTRTYPFYERRQILDAVAEHTAVFDGVDISMDPNTREIVTHFPWRGQRSGVTFELGSNISAYEAPTSVTDARTRAITQGLESSGADREEGIVTDMTGLGGVLVEGLNYAEPETPVTELESASRAAIMRSGHPVTDLTVTVGRVGAWDPALTSWMLDHVGVGDIVDVVIIDGTVNIVGPHRVIRRTLTPDTDTLRYALAPEPEEA